MKKKNNQNAPTLSSNGIVFQSCVKQACLRDLFGKNKTEWFPWFIFSTVLYVDEPFLTFFTFSVFCLVHVLIIH